MTKEFVTTYFDGEGRPWMEQCLRRSADWCVANSVGTLVIFTATGEGPHFAAKELLLQGAYKNLRIVAITPPVGRPYRQIPGDPNSLLVRSGLSSAMRDELTALGVSVVSAHLPFKEMYDGSDRVSEWKRVAEAYGVLGGGFALCIQAVLVACDAGLVEHGQQVVVASADTSLAVRACRTESFLSPLEGFLVEHIICRPSRYNISKRLHEAFAAPADDDDDDVIDTSSEDASDPKQLPSPAENVDEEES